MSPLTGKVVLITGGARGVGAAVAQRLHAKGARLVLTDLDEAALHDLAGDLGGDRVLALVADVRDLVAMQAAVSRAVDRFGGIDAVIANAGIGSYGSVLQVDPDAFRAVIDVNLVGVFNTVRAALPAVIERRGYVLIVSSLAAYGAAPGMAPYSATKAGVEQFANALRLEVAHHGVDVGSAHMSWIDTPLVREAKAEVASFREMIDSLPGPMRKTTSADKCAAEFVKGIEARKRRINCPRWVELLRWLKPIMSTPFVESRTLKQAPALVSRMDAEVAALQRSLSARTEALEKRPEQ
jgi:NAD(P)-dependent dehydrogenase (short-subunit alcohol dehydrogenase family)